MKKKFLVFLISSTCFFLNVSLNAQTNKQVDINWPTLANSSWPMIHGDPQSTGRAKVKGPQSSRVVWGLSTPQGILSGPTTGVDGTLYFGHLFKGIFYAVNPNGTLKWSYQTSSTNGLAPNSAILVGADSTIYVGSNDGSLYAFKPSGELKWKFETGAEIYQSVLTIDLQSNLYFTNTNGFLYSVKNNGALNWKIKIGSGFATRSTAISPDGNSIYICGADSNLYAINTDSTLKWTYRTGKNFSVPVVDSKGNIYILPKEKPFGLKSITPGGDLRWQYIIVDSLAITEMSSPTIDINGNIIFTTFGGVNSNRKLYSVDYSGNLNWTYQFEVNDDFTQPLVCDIDGNVYLGSTTGINYYAVSNKGNLLWQMPLNGYQVDNTSSFGADGTLYIALHSGSIDSNYTLIAIRDSTFTSLSEFISQPENFSLLQNYPNPFNPSTTISYKLKETGRVVLTVFDIMGREVAQLVNGMQSSGEHSVSFDGTNLPSGMYIYQLKTNGYISSRKMLLLK